MMELIWIGALNRNEIGLFTQYYNIQILRMV